MDEEQMNVSLPRFQMDILLPCIKVNIMKSTDSIAFTGNPRSGHYRQLQRPAWLEPIGLDHKKRGAARARCRGHIGLSRACISINLHPSRDGVAGT